MSPAVALADVERFAFACGLVRINVSGLWHVGVWVGGLMPVRRGEGPVNGSIAKPQVPRSFFVAVLASDEIVGAFGVPIGGVT